MRLLTSLKFVLLINFLLEVCKPKFKMYIHVQTMSNFATNEL